MLYYNSQFDTSVNGIKQIWSNLNRVCSAKKGKNNINAIDKLISSGQEIVDPVKISNTFNEYFCDIGPSLVRNLPKAKSSGTEYMSSSPVDTIFVDPVTLNELHLLILSLNCNKSCGSDGISPRLVKDNVHLLCEPLVYLYNLSLMNGIVPDKLKIAKIIPVFKKGDSRIVSNYQPISSLSIFDKLLEKIVYKRLYDFLRKNNVLYKYQFGFRKNHSTAMAILEAVDFCYENMDSNNKIVGIYFDLQKAFDTVDHNLLLNKLYHVGIRGLMHNWLTNYLSNRKQYTSINGVFSEMGDIVCGVPQGSVLGPLLFLIYVNDISTAVSDNSLRLFADDTNLFIFGSDLSELETTANDYLKKMEEWFVANKLNLNVEKHVTPCFPLGQNLVMRQI